MFVYIYSMYTRKFTVILLVHSGCKNKIKLNWKENKKVNKILININLMLHGLGLIETKNQLLTIKMRSYLLLLMFSWVDIPRVNIVVAGTIVHYLQGTLKSLLSYFNYSFKFLLLDASKKCGSGEGRWQHVQGTISKTCFLLLIYSEDVISLDSCKG